MASGAEGKDIIPQEGKPKSISKKKYLGQHFAKPRTLKRIIALAGPDNKDSIKGKTVVEIGAGDGRLTRLLAVAGAKKVYAIELDRGLCNKLDHIFNSEENSGNVEKGKVEIICGNILKIDFPACDMVFGNVPFYISSGIMKKLIQIQNTNHFNYAILMFQKEFVDKITSSGNKNMTALSVLANNYFEIKKLLTVDRDEFEPAPKVDATVIKLTPRAQPIFTEPQLKIAMKMFSNKKISMLRQLSQLPEMKGDRGKAGYILEKLGIGGGQRVYHLGLATLKKLMDEIT